MRLFVKNCCQTDRPINTINGVNLNESKGRQLGRDVCLNSICRSATKAFFKEVKLLIPCKSALISMNCELTDVWGPSPSSRAIAVSTLSGHTQSQGCYACSYLGLHRSFEKSVTFIHIYMHTGSRCNSKLMPEHNRWLPLRSRGVILFITRNKITPKCHRRNFFFSFLIV